MTSQSMQTEMSFILLKSTTARSERPISRWISCDIFAGEKILDVDYEEDSHAQVDMNFVLTESGKIVEIQGTAEELPFAEEDFGELMALAKEGIKQLIAEQKKVLGVK